MTQDDLDRLADLFPSKGYAARIAQALYLEPIVNKLMTQGRGVYVRIDGLRGGGKSTLAAIMLNISSMSGALLIENDWRGYEYQRAVRHVQFAHFLSFRGVYLDERARGRRLFIDAGTASWDRRQILGCGYEILQVDLGSRMELIINGLSTSSFADAPKEPS